MLALPVEVALAVTVLSTLVVEGPVALVEAGTVDCIVVKLVTGPPGSELDKAEDADDADDAAEEADESIDESEEATESEEAVALEVTEGAEEAEVRERDGDARDTEDDPDGRRVETEAGMDAVVRGSVTEAVMLLVSEPTVEMIERGFDIGMLRPSVCDADAAEEVEVWSSVDVVRRTPVAVRRVVSVICRATIFAASTLRRPSGAAKTTTT